MYRKLTSPCLHCAYKTVGCHSKCASYNEFKEYRENIKDKSREFRLNNEIHWDSIKRACSRSH